MRSLLPRVRNAAGAHLPALALGASLLVYVAAGLWTALNQRGVDFAVYYLAAKALPGSVDIYTLTDADWSSLAEQYHVPQVTPPYRYPPLTVGLVSLLADLPFESALLVWSALNIVALTLTGPALSQLLSGRWIDPRVFLSLTFYVPILTSVYAGQVNNLVLLGLALYLLFAQRRSLFASGLALAASWAIKPLAAPLAVHLIWRRDFARLLAAGTGLLIMSAVTITLSGTQVGLSYLQHAAELSTLAPDAPPVTYPPNQSLLGFFGRLLTPNEYAPAFADSAELARLLWLVSSAGIVSTVAILTWPRAQSSGDAFALETGLALVAINLIVPVSWYHHFTIAIIAFLVTAYAVRSRRLRIGLLIAFALVDAQGLLWHRLVSHTLLLSLGTYGLVILFVINAIAIWRRYPRRRAT